MIIQKSKTLKGFDQEKESLKLIKTKNMFNFIIYFHFFNIVI